MTAYFRTVDGDHINGEKDILSKKELMTLLRCSRSTVQRYMRQGMPSIPFDNGWTGYDLAAVQEWLRENGKRAPLDLVTRWRETAKVLDKAKEKLKND